MSEIMVETEEGRLKRIEEAVLRFFHNFPGDLFDGGKTVKIPIVNVSYSPSNEAWEQILQNVLGREQFEALKRLGFDREPVSWSRPLQHTSTGGLITVTYMDPKIEAKIDLCNLDLRARLKSGQIPREVFTSIHRVRDFRFHPTLPSVYTIDSQGSNWSVHCNIEEKFKYE